MDIKKITRKELQANVSPVPICKHFKQNYYIDWIFQKDVIHHYQGEFILVM